MICVFYLTFHQLVVLTKVIAKGSDFKLNLQLVVSQDAQSLNLLQIIEYFYIVLAPMVFYVLAIWWA